jgi:hypothetical protein
VPSRPFDQASLLVILATLALFVAALIVKGITQELFLEAGVFLVSVKLILMGYHLTRQMQAIQARIDEVLTVMHEAHGDPEDRSSERGDRPLGR